MVRVKVHVLGKPRLSSLRMSTKHPIYSSLFTRLYCYYLYHSILLPCFPARHPDVLYKFEQPACRERPGSESEVRKKRWRGEKRRLLVYELRLVVH